MIHGKLHPLPNTILMQYTGLKDKNGKEIYESDILAVSLMEIDTALDQKVEGKRILFEVVYAQFDTAFSAFDVVNECWVKLNALPYEIIGNIYENPELLEKV